MAKTKNKNIHPTTQYALDITKGVILANKWTRLAGQRHLDDLKEGHKRGLYFDENAANHIIMFFEEFLLFYEGEFDGKPFLLTPWQKFLQGSVFGWKNKDTGYRRFKTVYCESAKGGGKSPIAAGTGLYGLCFDDEPGSEIYSCATTSEQAGILFRDAVTFAEKSPSLREFLTINKHNIAYEEKNGFFRPVSSEHRGLDGKRPHMAMVDEVHEHPNDLVVRKMSAGTKTRRNPLIYEITNSGHDRQSICYQHHEYTEKILEGILQNDEWFGLISGIDVCPKCELEGKTVPQDGCPDCDDWRDEKIRIKASPNIEYLGQPYKDYYNRQVKEAIAMPAQENIVKRLNFNIWTDSITKWITADAWNACADRSLRLEDFAGKPCYMAFDLANKIDISALVRVFYEDGELFAFGNYWLPEETIIRSRITQYPQWVKEGRIIKTHGAMTDYRYIENDIKEINKINPIFELAFDPHEATYLVNNLMEWLGEDRCIEINQSPTHISEPMKQLEGLIYDKKIHHDGDSVLAWMISNVVKKESRSGGPVKFYYPTKACEDNKIDGAMALIMGVGRAMLHNQPVRSVYEGKSYEEIKEMMS